MSLLPGPLLTPPLRTTPPTEYPEHPWGQHIDPTHEIDPEVLIRTLTRIGTNYRLAHPPEIGKVSIVFWYATICTFQSLPVRMPYIHNISVA